MNWSDYEERYGESPEDFADDIECQTWAEREAEAAGVTLYGQL